MAWSDAARAAALEARRLHAQARSRLTWGGYTHQYSPTVRGNIAIAVRSTRAGQTYPGISPRDIMRHAVTSTFYRNRIRYKYGKDAT